MPLKKQYLKSKPVCKVTFKLPAEAAGAGQAAHLVGEFNDWDYTATPMRRLKDGSFTATVDLEVGRDYQFRYLIDGDTWTNDAEADRYEFNAFANEDNSVVSL